MEKFNHEKIYEIKSNKEKPKILYRGYQYSLRPSKGTALSWRCRVDGCTGKLKTNSLLAVTSETVHKHDADLVQNKVDYDRFNYMKGVLRLLKIPETSYINILSYITLNNLLKVPNINR